MRANRGNVGWPLVVVAAAVVAVIAIKTGIYPSSEPRQSEISETESPTRQASPTPSQQADKGEPDMSATPNSQQTHGSIQHANDADFQEIVLEAEGRVLVDFYADWCAPCRMIGPVLKELAQEEPTAQIVKVDVDRSPRVAMQYQIQAIPALMVFENGKVVGNHVGVADKATLRRMLGL